MVRGNFIKVPVKVYPIFGAPTEPRLVLMTSTPLAARAPHIAVAAASLSMVILSMSEGAIFNNAA